MAQNDEKEDNKPVLLTVEQVSRLFCVDDEIIRAAAEKGKLPHRRYGRRMLFEVNAVLAWSRQAGLDV
jgi:excisionase family DNA binding protein